MLGTTKPTFTSSSQNGQPVLNFISNNRLLTNLTMTAASGSFTVVCVMSNYQGIDRQYVFDSQTGRFIVAPSGSSGAAFPGWFDGAGWYNEPAAVSGWRVWVWNMNSGVTSFISTNGVNIGAGSVFNPVAIGGACAVGGAYDLSSCLLADIGEFRIYKESLSGANQAIVVSKLRTKFGL